MGSNTTEGASVSLLRPGADRWLDNQPLNRFGSLVPFRPWAWTCLALGVLALLRRLALTRARQERGRVSADLSGAGVLLMGVLLIAASSPDNDNAYMFAWLYDVGVVGISSALVRAGDNAVFLLCFADLLKCRLSSRRCVVVLVLVLVVLYLTWLPFVFIYPFFFNLNADFMKNTLIPILFVYIPNLGNIALNFAVFTQAALALYQANASNAIRVPKRVQLLSIKCIAHSVASTYGLLNLVLTGNPVQVVFGWNPYSSNASLQSYINYGIAVTVSVNVLFNCSIEFLVSLLPCKKAFKFLGCVATYDPRTGRRNSGRSISILMGPRSIRAKLETEGRSLRYRVERDPEARLNSRPELLRAHEEPSLGGQAVAHDVKAAACVSVDADGSNQFKRTSWLNT